MISIVVAGFNRCLSITTPSLNSCVIRPARAAFSENEILAVISRTRETITSLWSGENGHPEFEIPASLEPERTVTLEQELIDVENRDLVAWAIRKKDFSSPVQQDVVTNLLRALRVLEYAEKEISPRSKYILHMRPDLLVHDPFDYEKLISQLRRHSSLSQPAILTPNWGWQPNDKYAFLPAELVGSYFGRIRQFTRFVETDLEFSAESFLKFSLRNASIVPQLGVRASRVRLDGEIKKEDFKVMKFPKLKRRSRLHKLIRSLQRALQSKCGRG